MRTLALRLLVAALVPLLLASAAYAQTSEGRLFGTVTDPDGVPLPGATVTIEAPEMMGQRVAVTGPAGGFRFPAVPPGTYKVTVALSGFTTVIREGVVVPVGVTITLNFRVELASVEETITVTGESPVVDVKSSDIGASFSAENLKNVPTATDVWAILAMTPGIRMEAYDVGGSHKSQQLGYEAFGMASQNRVMTEGMDSTEGGGGTGFYFDYYSKDDVRVIGASGDVEMTTAGAFVIQNIKSGGNEYHGTLLQTYEPGSFVGDNIDADTAARGFTGNPNRLFWETHADIGGPISDDRLWFYGSANAFKIDKVISGVDPAVATDIGRIFVYTGKVTWRPTDRDQFTGFGYWQLKQKPNRGLGTNTPPESILAQNSWSRMWNGTWERTWSDSIFSEITAGVMGFSWPMVPAVDPATHTPRIDLDTNRVQGAGWGPFIFNRYKPQSRGSVYWYTDNSTGAHDFKFGYDWMIDSAQFGQNFNSGAVRYRDRGGVPSEIQIGNYPTFADDRDTHTDFYAQDTWTIADRVTINAGFRFQRQSLYYLDSQVNPVIGPNVVTASGEQVGFPAGLIQGQDVETFDSIGPRLGVNLDVLGDGRIALKGSWGRYHWNVNDDFDGVNPAGARSSTYEFNDLDGNGLWDCDPLHANIASGCVTNELGLLLSGGPGTLLQTTRTVDPGIKLPYTDEIAASVEWEVLPDAAIRAGFVRKSVRQVYDSVNLVREGNLTVNFTAVDPGPDGVTGTSDDGILNLRTIPESAFGLTDTVITNAPATDEDYDNIEIAFQKRFRRTGAFVLAGFDYGWREYTVNTSNSTSPLSASPIGTDYELDLNRDVPRRQQSSTWGFKAAGNFVLPADVGIGINLQINSGWNWARLATVRFPGIGTQRVFVEPIENNRSDTIALLNVRADKRIALPHGYLTVMGDVYNIINSNAVLNFNIRTGSSFNEIIQALDPITFMLGLRYEL